MGEPDLSLLRGTLDVLVLKALIWGPRHGYGVAHWIRETTDGELEVEEGALYTALHRLDRRGWVAAEWGLSENNRRAKHYTLTEKGRRQLALHEQKWRRYAAAVFKVLGATEAGA